MSEKRLASAFEFSEEELTFNHKGRISQAQRDKVRQQRAALVDQWLMFLAVIGLFGVLLLSNELQLIVVLLAVSLCLGMAFRVFQLRRDPYFNQAIALVGRIRLQVVDSKNGRLLIDTPEGERRFNITAEQLLALRDGAYYTVYSAPRSNVVLAVEPFDVIHEEESERDTLRNALDLETLTEAEMGDETSRHASQGLGDDGEIRRGRG